jgi:putative sterol carrier protein
MGILFPSDEWVKALADELNSSGGYRAAAKNWEGDFAFVITGPGGAPEQALYMDLWHGECRQAFVVPNPGEAGARVPEFTIEAPLGTWRKVIEKKLDPIQGLVTRQLKLKGQLLKIMRAPRAATELVHCCTLLPTDWPEG